MRRRPGTATRLTVAVATALPLLLFGGAGGAGSPGSLSRYGSAAGSHAVGRSAAYRQLAAVTVISRRDAWAVGHVEVGFRWLGLIEHWDGSSWSVVKGAALGAGKTDFQDVAAVSATDVWAVGEHSTKDDGTTALTEHWDGHIWKQVPNPGRGDPSGSELYGVSAASSDDVWAVGQTNLALFVTTHPLALHWDGKRWTEVKTPRAPPGNDRDLADVSVGSDHQAWSIGATGDFGSAEFTALIEGWDGTSWKVAAQPHPGKQHNSLQSVVTIGPQEALAVGAATDDGDTYFPLTMHYTSGHWRRVIGGPPVAVVSIDAAGISNVWAVGRMLPDGPPSVIARWTGDRWHRVASPRLPSPFGLQGIAVLGSNDAWAVGWVAPNVRHQDTVIEHWDGTRWSRVKSP